MENIKELLAQVKLFCQLDVAFCQKIEELEQSIYKLTEDNKRYRACLDSLERRYSEILYVVKSIKSDSANSVSGA